MKPLVSVIISTWNGEKVIKRAIDSILCQTYKNIEIIVYDDCSEDGTGRVVQNMKDKRIKYIKGIEKKNGAYGRNIAFANSKGEYIALIDDDDEWRCDKIQKQVEYLIRNSKYVAVLNDFIYRTEYDKYNKAYSSDYALEILLMKVKLAAGSTLMIRREIYEEIGGFDVRFNTHQDLQVLLSILRKYKIGYIPEALTIINGSMFRPLLNAKKNLKKDFRSIKELYLETFKDVIEKYPLRIQKQIYARNWLQVARMYLKEGNEKMAIEYLKKSFSYSFLFSNIFFITPHETYFLFIPLLIKNILKKK